MQLRPHHQTAASLLAVGVPAHRVAENIGFAVETVRKWIRDPKFQEILEVQQAEIRHKLQLGLTDKMRIIGHLSANEMIRRVRDEPETIRFSDLNNTLNSAADRTGASAPQRHEISLETSEDPCVLVEDTILGVESKPALLENNESSTESGTN